MGGSGYKKFVKKERAKVKLKGNNKKLLPKGQNVTDVNFRVKKIVIKSQIKEREEGEVLSKRKLNLQEVLSRLTHHNSKAKLDALFDLEGMLSDKGDSILARHFSDIVSQIAKAISAETSDVRKKANSLLGTILNSVSKDMCHALYGVLISRVCCGLTALDPSVRLDSLKTLDTLGETCSLKLASSVDQLLPILLDLIASTPSGSKCTLTVHVGQKESAGKWRAQVLNRINIILEAYLKNFLDKDTDLNNESETLIPWKTGLFIPNHRCFQYPSDQFSLSLSEGDFISNFSNRNKFEFKEFSTSMVSVMISAFAELVLNDDQESNGVITQEASDLLKNIIDILLALKNIVAKTDSDGEAWWNEKFGRVIYSKLVKNKFPYKIGSSGVKKKNKFIVDANLPIVNLKLALLTLRSINQSECSQVITYLKNRIRVLNLLTPEELHLLMDCILVILSEGGEHSAYFLNAVVKMSSEETDSPFPISQKILSSVALEPSLTYLHSEEAFISWAGSLLEGLANKSLDNLDVIVKMASRNYEPFRESLDSYIEQILDNLPKITNSEETKMKIASLIYWVSDWDEELIENLSKGITNNYWEERVSTHILHLVLAKSTGCAELRHLLCNHQWWNNLF